MPPHPFENNVNAITAKNLGVLYPGRVRALHDVSLSIPQGEFVAILGRSGAGKSTLLRCMNGLVQPTEGTLHVNNLNVTSIGGRRLSALRRDVGMIFQQFNLVTRLTTLQNVLTGRLAHARSPLRYLLSHFKNFNHQDHDIAMQSLDELGLAHKAHIPASQLSGGEQQRVAIARLMAQQPRVILADEPIASLDPGSAQRVMQALKHINQSKGISVLVNLHQPDIAAQFATRTVAMKDGRMFFDGNLDQMDQKQKARLYNSQASISNGENQ